MLPWISMGHFSVPLYFSETQSGQSVFLFSAFMGKRFQFTCWCWARWVPPEHSLFWIFRGNWRPAQICGSTSNILFLFTKMRRITGTFRAQDLCIDLSNIFPSFTCCNESSGMTPIYNPSSNIPWHTSFLITATVKAQKAEFGFLDLPSGDVFTNTRKAVLSLIKRGSQLLFSRWRWW